MEVVCVGTFKADEAKALRSLIDRLFMTEMQTQGMKVILAALEKQRPMKLTKAESNVIYGCCPTCGRVFWGRYRAGNYCDECGQRLEL